MFHLDDEQRSSSATDIAEHLYLLANQQRTAEREAQLRQAAQLAASLLALIDPAFAQQQQPGSRSDRSAAQPLSPSSGAWLSHLHSSCQYVDPHRCESQSVLECVPLLLLQLQRLSAVAAAAFVSDFLSICWPHCCLVSLCSAALGLPLSIAQTGRLQRKIHSCLTQQRAQPSQPQATDYLPLVQCLFHLTVRYAAADSHREEADDDREEEQAAQQDAASAQAALPSLPAADVAPALALRGSASSFPPPVGPSCPVSWLSLLHLSLSLHRRDLLSNSHYLLDARLHQSAAFSSYLHCRFQQLSSNSELHTALDHHHVALVLLLATDDDYQARAFRLLAALMRHHLLDTATTCSSSASASSRLVDGLSSSVSSSSPAAPLVFFSPSFAASAPTVQLWRDVVSLPYFESKQSLLLQFALYLMQAEEVDGEEGGAQDAGLLSLSFHLVLLLFASFPPSRASVFEQIRSRLFFDSLPGSQRPLLCSLLAFLVLSSPPSHLSPLREHVKRFLSCLTLPQPLSLSLHCLLSLLPVFLPSCSCCPLDDLFPFLNKWLRAYRSEHPSLSLCACLWLLARMQGGDDDERGLLRIIEDGGRRMTEEGRAWMLSQLHRILIASQRRTACACALSAEPAVSASPAALSLSASCLLDPPTTLSFLLSSSTYSLSPLALSHVLHLLQSQLSHYLHLPAASEAGRRSKWALPQPLLHIAACFRLEWGSVGEEEDEDDVYARRRRREMGGKKRRKAIALVEQQGREQEAHSVALRDPIALQLLCAWSALSADQAAFAFSSFPSFPSSSSSSSSSTGSPASLLSLMSGLLQQLLDGSSFVPLLQPRPRPSSVAAGKDDAKDTEAAGGLSAVPAASASPTVSESLVSDHQRWSLLQAICVVGAQTLWEDTAHYRRASQQQRQEQLEDEAVVVLAAEKPPISTFIFSPLPPVPVQTEKRDKDNETSSSSIDPLPPVFSLLRSLSSTTFDSQPLSQLHQWPMLLLEQAAFVHLLTEVSPAPAELPASSLSPSLLLSPAFLIQLLNDYALSVSTAAAPAPLSVPVCAVDPSPKKSAAVLPSLSLVSVSYAIRLLMQSILAQPASRFPSVPAAALLPSVTPPLPAPAADSDAASSSPDGISLQAVFRSVFDVYCATLGVCLSSLSECSLTSASPLLAAPSASIGRAVFVSARHLSALFERATASSSPAFSSAAWLKATAVYEQPDQYREEVWACRTQALLSMNRLLQLQPDCLPADLLPAFASDASDSPCSTRRGLLSLMLVRLFLLELDSQMTVPLAHAYIDCIQTLQPAAAVPPSSSSPLLSPSPSLRLTRALLHAVTDYPALLTADLRLARKVWRHILSSFHGPAGRAEAMQLVERTVKGMMAEEKKKQEERAKREKQDALPDSLEAVRRAGGMRLRQRGRGRQRLQDAEDAEAAEDGSDDSEFDDHRERRQQRFLSRLSRSALMEAERQREDERQDRQELREKKLRKETLAAILRYCNREIKDMRTQWRLAARQQQQKEEERKDGSSFRSPLRSSLHSCSLFLSQVLSLLSCLSSGCLASLLDPSFSSSSLPSSDSPSVSLHSQLLSLLHDCLHCSAAIMRRVTAGLQDDDDDDDSGERQEGAAVLAVDLLRALSSQLAATRAPEGGDRKRGKRRRKAEEAEDAQQQQQQQQQQQKAALEFPPHLSSTAPASELTVLHHLRHLSAMLAPSSPLLSFVSLPSLPSSKAVDVKLAIGKARSAALLLTSALQDLSSPKPQLQQQQEEKERDGEDAAEAAESHSARTARRSSGRLRRATEEVVEERKIEETAAAETQEEEEEEEERGWEGWLQQLRQELEDGRSRRGGEQRTEVARSVGVRRRRGCAVLHSRNRHVDALLAEERETQDSFMDLDDFLV